MRMYALKDIKSAKFYPPFLFPNDELSIRGFTTLVNAPKEDNISLYPEDFDLYCIGEYNEDTAEIVSAVRFIINGENCKRKTEE